MKNITAIIAEYNPFHKGHQYHIEQARLKTEADAIVVVMSGNFVQRGCCAAADKYTRAQAALSCGADLVLELPVLYACASAEYFAGGAVTLLEKTGIISHLAFGCESASVDSLRTAAQILADEPPRFRQSLRRHLADGYSFPKARELALCELQPDMQPLLSQPNNILGIEYCKRLHVLDSRIQATGILRQGGGYHQVQKDGQFSSATSIRDQLAHNIRPEELAAQLPLASYELLKEQYKKSFPVFDEDLSSYVHYALLNVRNGDYSVYLDVSEDLSARIRKQLPEYRSFHQFATLLKTKELTYSRICRCLIHIVLNLTKDIYEPLLKGYEVPYVRVLGMRDSAAPVLGMIQSRSAMPIIMNPADYLSGRYRSRLSDCGRLLLEADCLAAHIWNGAVTDKYKQKLPGEYSRKFLKIL